METHLETYLSPYVHNLLVNFSQSSEINDGRTFLRDDLTIDWSTVSDMLGNLPEDFNILEQPASWYEGTLKRMWSVYHSIHTAFLKADRYQQEQFYSLLEWTGQSEEILNHYSQYLRSKSEESKLKLLLYLTSILERNLGNIYYSMKPNVPFLLRDLLNTSELKCVLGIIPTTFVQLIVGTPRGLNLRNVAWHGFVKPSEISEVLITVLIVIFASIKIILSSPASVISVPNREHLKLSKFDCVLQEDSPGLFQSSHLRYIVNKSSIIPPVFKPLWIYALDLAENSRHGECCMILLPQSELLLRCMFCAINSCSSRLLTAEADTLYTTFDHILQPTLSENEDAEENKLYFILTVDLITMLNDLFTFPHGPRLRDKLSHGEIKMEDVSSHLYHYFIHVMTSIILKLNKHFQFKELDSESRSENPLANFNFKSVVYYPKFHLISVAKRSILKVIQEMKDWNQCQQPEGFFLRFFANEVDTSDLELNLNSFLLAVEKRGFLTESEKPSFKLLNGISQFKISSYHCSVFQNREFMVYLIQVTEKMSEVHDNVRKSLKEKYLQWNEFKLRERGRNTYAKILQVAPVLRLCLLSVLYSVILNFIAASLSFELPSSLSDMKVVFSAIQNIHCYTDSSVNRWLEVISITRNVIHPVLKRSKIETVPFSILMNL